MENYSKDVWICRKCVVRTIKDSVKPNLALKCAICHKVSRLKDKITWVMRKATLAQFVPHCVCTECNAKTTHEMVPFLQRRYSIS